MVLASAGKPLQLNIVPGQSVSKLKMDNPSFLWHHKAEFLRHVFKLPAYIALETLKQQIGLT